MVQLQSVVFMLLVATTRSFLHQSTGSTFRTHSFSQSFSSSSSSSSIHMSNFLSVSECIKRQSEEDPKSSSSASSTSTIFMDGSWHLSSRDGRSEYEAGPRIKDALFFDIDDVATKDVNDVKRLPHMMPPKQLFAQVMDNMGIKSTNDIILYGTKGCFSIPRAFFTLRSMGHPPEKVYMMAGSLTDWIDAGGSIETEQKNTFKVDELELSAAADDGDDIQYDTAVSAKNIVDINQVKNVVTKGEDETNTIIIDARSAGRFVGEAPEPRPGLRGGHMPGAYNVPFNILLNEDNMSKFKSKNEMTQIFKDAGVDVMTDKKIIASCGSGVTACVLSVALEECGRDMSNTSIYDGSWIDWASDQDTTVVKS